MGVVIAKKIYEKPEEGSYLAVLADVVDLGMKETSFGMKDRLALVWQLDALNSEGYRFQVRQEFTKSLHENAGLAKTIKQITGQMPTAAEFDTEPLIGITRILHIEHNTNAKGDVFANVALIQRTKDVLEVDDGFVRQQDKEPQQRRAMKPTPAKSAPAPASSAPRTAAGAATAKPAAAAKPAVRTAAPATAPKPRAVAPAAPVVEEATEFEAEAPISDEDIPF